MFELLKGTIEIIPVNGIAAFPILSALLELEILKK